MSNFKFRRLLVIERRQRLAKIEELKPLMNRWSFWSNVLARLLRSLLPYLLVSLVIFGSVVFASGFLLGVQYLGKRVDAEFICSPRVHH